MSDEQRDDPWDEIDEVLRASAQLDLERTGAGGLYVAAAAGRAPLMVATSRPFPKGGYIDPVIELTALACLLDADRLAIGATGRTWSLDDPIPPVTDEVDLRQRVLFVQTADAHERRIPSTSGTVHPYDLRDATVRWHDPVTVGTGEGWLAEALPVLLRVRHEALATLGPDEAAKQYERCLRLGHDIGLTVDSAARLLPRSSAS